MNHRQTTLVFFALVLVVFNIESIHAEPVNFEKQIQPIFAAHCLECHGPDAHESGLRLDQRGNMLRGGDYGEATIVPNDPDASFLLRANASGGTAALTEPGVAVGTLDSGGSELARPNGCGSG